MTAQLSGENRIAKFRRIAKELAAKLSSSEGVVGIAFIGGLVRGFADKYSDLDLVVLLAERDEQLRRQLSDLSSEVERRNRADIDLEVHFVEDFKRRTWDETDRWEFSKAEIVFDPQGIVKEVFTEKLRVPKGFWVRRIAMFAEYLKWYCCPPKEGIGTIAEMWVDRDDLLSAHYCLNYGVDLTLKIVFALNKEHLPAPKWRLFYSYNLEWLPRDYRKLIKGAMKVKDFSAEELNHRLKAVQKLWQRLVPRIEDETGLTIDGLSEYFVENILRVRLPKYK